MCKIKLNSVSIFLYYLVLFSCHFQLLLMQYQRNQFIIVKVLNWRIFQFL